MAREDYLNYRLAWFMSFTTRQQNVRCCLGLMSEFWNHSFERLFTCHFRSLQHWQVSRKGSAKSISVTKFLTTIPFF